MTPVDALDTMLLMGLDDEAAQDPRVHRREPVASTARTSVKIFEITIRVLGGLLSSYQMTGDKRLLALAEDLGDRLLPAFDSPTGMPYMYVNLTTGARRGAESNPAEIGTLLLEFGTLAKLTGRDEFYDKAKRALVAVYERRAATGLVGERDRRRDRGLDAHRSATSAARSTRTSSTCSSASACSATRSAARCGARASPR